MPDLATTIFVSRRSHEQDVRPGFVYREEPDDARDSGWRALAGDETEVEVDDPGSILVLDLVEFLDRWPEVRRLVDTDPAPGEWSWDESVGRFVPL